MKKGKLYVIEGLDGSGKATQAQALYEKLRERGILVRKVSFPNYARRLRQGPFLRERLRRLQLLCH